MRRLALPAELLTDLALLRPARVPADPPAPTLVPTWQLRSGHFASGMPVATHERHQSALPSGRIVPGLSVLVKVGFVVGR